jgi:hypothetical protein
VKYLLQPNRIEWRKGIVWDETPGVPAPDFSFPLLFKSSLSVLPPQRVHVIVTGTQPLYDGAAMTLKFPSAPLFILHAPPGGTSATSLEKGDSLQLARQALYLQNNAFEVEGQLGPAAAKGEKWCSGAPGQCRQEIMWDYSWEGTAVTQDDFGRADKNVYKLSRGYTYTQSYSTGQNRRANGDDSVVLIYNGLQRLVESMTVAQQQDAQGQPIACAVQDAYSSISWLEGGVDKDWFQWVSKWEIGNVILPQQRRMVTTLKQQIARNDSNANPESKVSMDNLKALLASEQSSLSQWEDTLLEFDRSSARAVPFTPTMSESSAMIKQYNQLPSENPMPKLGVGTVDRYPSPPGKIGASGTLDSPAYPEVGPAPSAVGTTQPPQIQRFQEDSLTAAAPAGFYLSYSGGGSATAFTVEMEAEEWREDEDVAKINYKVGIAVSKIHR